MIELTEKEKDAHRLLKAMKENLEQQGHIISFVLTIRDKRTGESRELKI
jgi:hypothetical protein